jgi:type I restriction enzyme M protein
MFAQTFKNLDRVLRLEAGCSSELDYSEQSSWLLFLKYLDDLEAERELEAELNDIAYVPIIDGRFQWGVWAAPKRDDGEIDFNLAMTGDDLIDFVDGQLWPYLRGFKQRAAGPDTIEYKIGEIFAEVRSKFRSGYSLRNALNLIDALDFRAQNDKHELSALYEEKIKRMGNAGRNGGEYYTPRPLIRAMIQVTQPRIGETVYDGAVGSAGFLCEAFEHMRPQAKTADDIRTLQTRTFFGKEKKSLAYVIGIMNMILHGIEAPRIIHTNTLTESLSDIQPKDQMDIVLANPPFGGDEQPEVQHNFPIRAAETAYLFLQHFIRMLKPGGRGAVVIKNTFLSNSDNASVALRRELLSACTLHTILDCPQGTFQGAGVKTVVLFFEKGAPTRDIWVYQLSPGRNMGKNNPLNDADLAEFVELQKTFAEGPKSWRISRAGLDEDTADLSVKNPNAPEAEALRSPEEIIADMLARDAETAEILQAIRGLL